MKIRVTRIHPGAIIPSYGTEKSAAFDLTTAELAAIPGKSHGRIPIGLVFGLPPGHVLHIFARSSTFPRYGLMLANGVGVIDEDYSGPEDEISLLVYNAQDKEIAIPAGTRLAQAIVYPRPKIEFEEGPAQGPSRGGYGSTGI